MKINFFSIIILSAVLAPAPGLAADTSGNSFFPDRAKQIEEETGIKNLGTYQQEAAEEAAKKAAEERKKAGEELKFDFGLKIGKVILSAQNFAADAFSDAKKWLFEKVPSKTTEVPVIPIKNPEVIITPVEKIALPPSEEGPAIKEPLILMFSAVKRWLQSQAFFPSTPESIPRIVPGVGRSQGVTLAGILSTPVPLECRSDFNLCITCPRLSDPGAIEKIDFPADCDQCVLDNYNRLQKCRLDLSEGKLKKKRLELSENELKKKRLELLERALGRDILELLESARRTLKEKIPPTNVPPVVIQSSWDGIYSLVPGDLKCNGDAENLAVPPEEFVVDQNTIYVEGFEFSEINSDKSTGNRVGGDLKIPTGVGTSATVKVEMSMNFYRDSEGVKFEGTQTGYITIPAHGNNPGYGYTCQRAVSGERLQPL